MLFTRLSWLVDNSSLMQVFTLMSRMLMHFSMKITWWYLKWLRETMESCGLTNLWAVMMEEVGGKRPKKSLSLPKRRQLETRGFSFRSWSRSSSCSRGVDEMNEDYNEKTWTAFGKQSTWKSLKLVKVFWTMDTTRVPMTPSTRDLSTMRWFHETNDLCVCFYRTDPARLAFDLEWTHCTGLSSRDVTTGSICFCKMEPISTRKHPLEKLPWWWQLNRMILTQCFCYSIGIHVSTLWMWTDTTRSFMLRQRIIWCLQTSCIEEPYLFWFETKPSFA